MRVWTCTGLVPPRVMAHSKASVAPCSNLLINHVDLTWLQA